MPVEAWRWGIHRTGCGNPCEVIADLGAVMTVNLMNGVAADGLLHFWGAEGVMHLAEPDLFQLRPTAGAEALAAVVNDRRTGGKDRCAEVVERDRLAAVLEPPSHQIFHQSRPHNEFTTSCSSRLMG